MAIGTGFQISPSGGGGSAWSETGLFNIPNPVHDGEMPIGGLVFDKAQKHVFGTTIGVGPRKEGAVFELARKLSRTGRATFSNLKILHAFVAAARDGGAQYAGPVFGPDGSLYGPYNSAATARAVQAWSIN